MKESNLKWFKRFVMLATFGIGFLCSEAQRGNDNAQTMFLYYNLGLLVMYGMSLAGRRMPERLEL